LKFETQTENIKQDSIDLTKTHKNLKMQNNFSIKKSNNEVKIRINLKFLINLFNMKNMKKFQKITNHKEEYFND
jgi:hypothetical protein